ASPPVGGSASATALVSLRSIPTPLLRHILSALQMLRICLSGLAKRRNQPKCYAKLCLMGLFINYGLYKNSYCFRMFLRIKMINYLVFKHKQNKLYKNIIKLSKSLMFDTSDERIKNYYKESSENLKKNAMVLKNIIVNKDYSKRNIFLSDIKNTLDFIGSSSTKGEINIARNDILQKIYDDIYIFQELKYIKYWNTG
ncbi:MAG: hypothetical protein LBJ86_04900, partial [Spirochaetaceae bacterium]|nr:hypothetical protein [Spirochaetaceae bacterium]